MMRDGQKIQVHFLGEVLSQLRLGRRGRIPGSSRGQESGRQRGMQRLGDAKELKLGKN